MPILFTNAQDATRFRKSTSEIIIKLLSNIQKNLQHTFLFLFPIKSELVEIDGDDDDDKNLQWILN